MSKKRRYFSREFKLRAIKRVENRDDRSMESIALELGVHANLLSKWKKEFQKTSEQNFLHKDPAELELERLRKEVADLKEEKEILKKALTIFSQRRR